MPPKAPKSFAEWKVRLNRSNGYSPSSIVGRLFDQVDLTVAKHQLVVYQKQAKRLSKEIVDDIIVVEEVGDNAIEGGVVVEEEEDALSKVLFAQGDDANVGPSATPPTTTTTPKEEEEEDLPILSVTLLPAIPRSPLPSALPLTRTTSLTSITSSTSTLSEKERKQNESKKFLKLVADGRVRYLQKEIQHLEHSIKEDLEELKSRPLFKDTRLAFVSWKNQTLGIKPYVQPENVKSILKDGKRKRKKGLLGTTQSSPSLSTCKLTFRQDVEEIVFERDEYVDEDLDFAVEAYI
ncbi:UNVERIFIED_CONTAM: hypothetical protein HDU68_002020 [Siphonaria sp. JEL0065]|nr:hypothetical protein HDU68_002020 [Siphonaria sp. JEL0065]